MCLLFGLRTVLTRSGLLLAFRDCFTSQLPTIPPTAIPRNHCQPKCSACRRVRFPRLHQGQIQTLLIYDHRLLLTFSQFTWALGSFISKDKGIVRKKPIRSYTCNRNWTATGITTAQNTLNIVGALRALALFALAYCQC